MSVSKKNQKMWHDITALIHQAEPTLVEKDSSLPFQLVAAAKHFFEQYPRDKAHLFTEHFAEHEHKSLAKANRLMKSISKLLHDPRMAGYLDSDPVAHAAIMAVSGAILTGGIELLDHPDVVKLRKKILKSYDPPRAARIALFMPCSKTKPYRHSRTHKAIDETIDDSLIRTSVESNIIDKIVISEPFGVVPRSWELHYPAMNYDMVLPTWLPLDKLNAQGLTGESRSRTFMNLSKVSNGRGAGSKTKIIVDQLSGVIAEFLKAKAQHYDRILGYVRSTHRRMLDLAAKSAGVQIQMIPTEEEIRGIIDEFGKLHWAFQGLRGKPARTILAERLEQYISPFQQRTDNQS